MTFRHLANMTSGYARPEEPGKAWAYNDFAIQLYQKTLFDRVFKDDPDAVANAAARLGGLGPGRWPVVHARPPPLEGLGPRLRPHRLVLAASRQVAGPPAFADSVLRRIHAAADAQGFARVRRPRKRTTISRSARYGGGSEHFTRFGAGIYGFNWWFNDTGRLHPAERTWPDAPADTVMSIGAGGNCSVLLPGLNMIVACAQGDWGDWKRASATRSSISD